MKNILWIFVIALTISVNAWGEASYTTRNINNLDIACLSLGKNTANCYVVSTKDNQAVVIDPGGNPEAIRGYITMKGLKVMYILVTHGHQDHIKGLPGLVKFIEAPVGIESSDRRLYEKRMGDQGPFTMFFFDGSGYGFGELAYTVVHSPGHSPGSVCFYFENAGVLFSGDTLFNRGVGRTDFDGGSASDLQSSLKKLGKLPPNTQVFPGHGGSTTIGNEL